MNIDEFWQLVEQAGDGRKPKRQARRLAKTLSKFPPEEIMSFDRWMVELAAVSYSWDLWGAAYLINGGCSDDGFDYFRAWLIAQGRSVFETAVVDPDSLALLRQTKQPKGSERMLGVSYMAFAFARSEMPMSEDDDYQPLPDLGEGWDFDDRDEMRARYPRLYEKYGYG